MTTPAWVLLLVVAFMSVVGVLAVTAWLLRSFMGDVRGMTVDSNALLSKALDALAEPRYEPEQAVPTVAELRALTGLSPVNRGVPSRAEQPEMFQDPFEDAIDPTFSPPLAPTGKFGWHGDE